MSPAEQAAQARINLETTWNAKIVWISKKPVSQSLVMDKKLKWHMERKQVVEGKILSFRRRTAVEDVEMLYFKEVL